MKRKFCQNFKFLIFLSTCDENRNQIKWKNTLEKRPTIFENDFWKIMLDTYLGLFYKDLVLLQMMND